MKRIILLFFVLATLTSFAQFSVLEIGAKLPQSEKMQSTSSDKMINLESLVKENGLLVIFSCNTCPFVVQWEDRYPLLDEIAKTNKVGFVLINSNYMKREGDDSFEAMKKHAEVHKYQWPYLVDKESKLANAFGAQTTPHVFLFDKNMKLVYKGAIDDNYKDASAVEEFYLKEALESLGKGEEIKNKETRNLGCSIKRKTT